MEGHQTTKPGRADPPTDPSHRIEAELERLHAASFGWSLACCRGDRQEAEDVLQTAYLKVLDGRARFAGRSALKTWFFSVIRRTATERGRRQSWRLGLLERWVGPAQPLLSAPQAGPGVAAAGAERSRRVARALATLSLRQRQVLELVFHQDLSLSESAEVLGITVGAARSHYARGKKALLNQLGDLR